MGEQKKSKISKSLDAVRERERERELYFSKIGSHGITLVALVITIIVLMILAGVSLSFVLGDNGILKKAQESADAYKNASQSEQQTLQNIENYLYGEKNNTEENTTGNNTTGGGETATDTINSTSYVGCYADVDGDGTVDGIIYADLAIGGSGTWNNNSWSKYEYAKVNEGLKSYTVSSTDYTGFNSRWTKPVINVKKGSTGTNRFYVMALEDINPGTVYYWYCNADGKLDDPVEPSANDFGQGRTNTEKMVAEWNKGASGKYGAQHKDDLWGIIQGKTVDDKGNITTDETKNYVSKGWYVPSKAEWAAFGDMAYTKMGVTTSNYPDYGLQGDYWASAQSGEGDTFGADVGSGYIFSYNIDSYGSVARCILNARLGATF